MRKVKEEVTLEWVTPDAACQIERAGRTCYKSEDKITQESAEKFCRRLLDDRHDAMIEHACASMRFVCDRGVSHEVVRHRLFSFGQESTRYCNYSKAKFGAAITVIQPPCATVKGSIIWHEAMEAAEKFYFKMLDYGESPQIARSVLPNSLKTEIVVTGNMREWRHFFKLRLAKDAHPQMRIVAGMAFAIFERFVPCLSEGLVDYDRE